MAHLCKEAAGRRCSAVGPKNDRLLYGPGRSRQTSGPSRRDRSQSDRSVARRSAAAIRAIKARFPHRFSLNVRSSAYSFRGTRCGAGRIWPSHRPCRRRKLKGLKWLPGGSRPLPRIDCANQTFRRSEPLLGTVVPKMRLLRTIAISALEQMGNLLTRTEGALVSDR
jgi:hypothetical protein